MGTKFQLSRANGHCDYLRTDRQKLGETIRFPRILSLLRNPKNILLPQCCTTTQVYTHGKEFHPVYFPVTRRITSKGFLQYTIIFLQRFLIIPEMKEINLCLPERDVL